MGLRTKLQSFTDEAHSPRQLHVPAIFGKLEMLYAAPGAARVEYQAKITTPLGVGGHNDSDTITILQLIELVKNNDAEKSTALTLIQSAI